MNVWNRKNKQISDEETPEKVLGCFSVKSIYLSFGVKKYLDLMQNVTGFHFSIFSFISSLIYATILILIAPIFFEIDREDDLRRKGLPKKQAGPHC